MFSKGKTSVSLADILSRVDEAQILNYYLGITKIPCFINSPLREDKRPSFGLYSSDGKRIYFTDMSTGDRGGLFDLLGKIWSLKYTEVLNRIYKDLKYMIKGTKVSEYTPSTVSITHHASTTKLQVKVRPWKQWDIDYWNSYGITLDWLKYAEVFPISQIFITKKGITKSFPADKYAYAYVEHKEGNTTIKVYQPKKLSSQGKWLSKHDRSVISLWSKIPEYGQMVVICSSLKDALCLWSNTGIPAIAIQGEAYGISETAISELKRRYKEIYILLDNDDAGKIDSEKLSISTGFTNIVLPSFEGGKDVSDLMKELKGDKKKFCSIIIPLFKNTL